MQDASPRVLELPLPHSQSLWDNEFHVLMASSHRSLLSGRLGLAPLIGGAQGA